VKSAPISIPRRNYRRRGTRSLQIRIIRADERYEENESRKG
jgi:hypothetical protein